MPPVERGTWNGPVSTPIDWSLRLYNHLPPKPVVNGAAWYEDVALAAQPK